MTLPDLVISDIRMPNVTGLDVLRSLRRRHLDVPVILMTAFGDQATQVEIEALSGRMLSKPFRLPQLVALAERLLEAH